MSDVFAIAGSNKIHKIIALRFSNKGKLAMSPLCLFRHNKPGSYYLWELTEETEVTCRTCAAMIKAQEGKK